MARTRRIFRYAVLASWIFLLHPTSLAAWQDRPTDLSGFDPSEIASVEDGQSFAPSNVNLVRLLYRAAKISDQSILRFSQDEIDSVAKFQTDGRSHRMKVFQLAGRAKKVIRYLKFDNVDQAHPFCLVVAATETDEHRFAVAVPAIKSQQGYTANLPRVWHDQDNLNQPMVAEGFFLANFEFDKPLLDSQTEESGPIPLFVAKRISWFPQQTNPRLRISNDHVVLATYGVDITRLDVVASNNNRRMSEGESTVFYQMLNACSLAAGEFPADSAEFNELLSNATKHFGRAARVTGRVRRVSRIEVTAPQDQQLLGQDHYFEVDLFVPLTDSKIVVNPKQAEEDRSTESAPAITYDNRFPVTVCIKSLPIGSLEKANVNVNGYFFRLWNYPSVFTSEVGSGAGQVCPLIIATSAEIVDSRSEEGQAFLTTLLIGFFAAILLLGICAIFYLKASDRAGEPLQDLPDEIQILD